MMSELVGHLNRRVKVMWLTCHSWGVCSTPLGLPFATAPGALPPTGFKMVGGPATSLAAFLAAALPDGGLPFFCFLAAGGLSAGVSAALFPTTARIGSPQQTGPFLIEVFSGLAGVPA